ncbi:MAG: hypothetical protein ACWIPH_02360 [Ostreibacterium sp.]
MTRRQTALLLLIHRVILWGTKVYYFPQLDVVFVGDTLFSMGCGRLFEGTPQQKWQSIQQLKYLPPNTAIYCTHEYTLSNARFALAWTGAGQY